MSIIEFTTGKKILSPIQEASPTPYIPSAADFSFDDGTFDIPPFCKPVCRLDKDDSPKHYTNFLDLFWEAATCIEMTREDFIKNDKDKDDLGRNDLDKGELDKSELDKKE